MRKGFLKRVAHTINKQGTSPTYASGFDAWWSEQPNTAKPIIEDKAVRAYNKIKKGPDAGEYTVKERLAENAARRQEALKWWYDNKIDHSGGDAKASVTPAQIAAAGSLVGAATSAVPHPIAKVIGTALSIPDQIYDGAALIDTPSTANGIYTTSNYLESLAKVGTPGGKYDDYVAKGLGMIGNAFDAAQVGNKDVISDLTAYINKK